MKINELREDRLAVHGRLVSFEAIARLASRVKAGEVDPARAWEIVYEELKACEVEL